VAAGGSALVTPAKAGDPLAALSARERGCWRRGMFQELRITDSPEIYFRAVAVLDYLTSCGPAKIS
jgi:hypothetical protein